MSYILEAISCDGCGSKMRIKIFTSEPTIDEINKFKSTFSSCEILYCLNLEDLSSQELEVFPDDRQ